MMVVYGGWGLKWGDVCGRTVDHRRHVASASHCGAQAFSLSSARADTQDARVTLYNIELR